MGRFMHRGAGSVPFGDSDHAIRIDFADQVETSALARVLDIHLRTVRPDHLRRPCLPINISQRDDQPVAGAQQFAVCANFLAEQISVPIDRRQRFEARGHRIGDAAVLAVTTFIKRLLALCECGGAERDN